MNVKVIELKPRKLRIAFQIWSAMMNNGKPNQKAFSKLLTESDQPIDPYRELLKSICGRQNTHTLPALGLAITERMPTHDPAPFVSLLFFYCLQCGWNKYAVIRNKYALRFVEAGIKLRKELQEVLGEDGVLLFPSFPVVAPYHNIPLFTNSLDFLYFGIINALGFPSTQCPMGLSSEGLPTGVQVISNHLNDHITMKIAELFESQLVGWIPP